MEHSPFGFLDHFHVSDEGGLLQFHIEAFQRSDNEWTACSWLHLFSAVETIDTQKSHENLNGIVSETLASSFFGDLRSQAIIDYKWFEI